MSIFCLTGNQPTPKRLMPDKETISNFLFLKFNANIDI